MSAAEVFRETPTHRLKTTSAFDRPQKRPLATTLHDAFPAPPVVTGSHRSPPLVTATLCRPSPRLQNSPGSNRICTRIPRVAHLESTAEPPESTSKATQQQQFCHAKCTGFQQLAGRFSPGRQSFLNKLSTRCTPANNQIPTLNAGQSTLRRSRLGDSADSFHGDRSPGFLRTGFLHVLPGPPARVGLLPCHSEPAACRGTLLTGPALPLPLGHHGRFRAIAATVMVQCAAGCVWSRPQSSGR